jgi:hypothetical protein
LDEAVFFNDPPLQAQANHFRDKNFFIKKNELQLLLGRNKNLVGWSRSLIFKMEQVHLKHLMDCIKYTSASNIWEK